MHLQAGEGTSPVGFSYLHCRKMMVFFQRGLLPQSCVNLRTGWPRCIFLIGLDWLQFVSLTINALNTPYVRFVGNIQTLFSQYMVLSISSDVLDSGGTVSTWPYGFSISGSQTLFALSFSRQRHGKMYEHIFPQKHSTAWKVIAHNWMLTILPKFET